MNIDYKNKYLKYKKKYLVLKNSKVKGGFLKKYNCLEGDCKNGIGKGEKTDFYINVTHEGKFKNNLAHGKGKRIITRNEKEWGSNYFKL